MADCVLVVAANPDDEVLNYFGIIAPYFYNSDQVLVLIVAEGVTSRQYLRDRNYVSDELSALTQAAQAA